MSAPEHHQTESVRIRSTGFRRFGETVSENFSGSTFPARPALHSILVATKAQTPPRKNHKINVIRHPRCPSARLVIGWNNHSVKYQRWKILQA